MALSGTSPLISVITPTHDPEAPYLGDERVHLECNGRHLGVAMTRNRACVRARGELIQVYDSDDVLLPGAMEALYEAISTTDVAYAVGRIKHMVGGEIVDHYAHGRPRLPKPPFGEVAPGELSAYWFKYGRYPYVTNHMMWHRDIFLAWGGQSALEVGEDADMALAISERLPGHYLDYFVTICRAHDESLMHDPDFFQSGLSAYPRLCGPAPAGHQTTHSRQRGSV